MRRDRALDDQGSRRRVGGAVAPLALASLLALVSAPPALADGWIFVQDQRVNSLTLQFGTDVFATQDAFGGAFVGGSARNMLQSALASSVADGSISWLLEMRDLTDLSGTSDPSFNVGVFNATPAAPGAGNPATYDGTSDLDWWYSPDLSEVADDGSARQQLPASFVARILNAGPGTVRLFATLGGQPAALAMSSTRLTALAGDSSKPLESTNGLPPGHLPEENLPDSLTSFETMSSGKLAGDISARSLADVPIPASLVGLTCAADYTTSRVTGCTHDGVAASLDDCLDGAAYSSYFQFTTDRVIDLLQVSTTTLLTVSRVGSGSGTVTSSPTGVDCGDDCAERYQTGAQVTLTADPFAGSRFDGWTDCDNAFGTTCAMTMDADKQVAASFVQQHTLTVSTNGSGTGSVSSSPAGIDCGADCSQDYDQGTQITLTATAASGSTFSGWSGACTGIGMCTLSITIDRSVTATFMSAPSADVRLTMTGPASAPRGAQVTYLITVSNVGPSTAHNVVLSNPVPSGVKFLGVTTSQGTCGKPSRGTITCWLGDLAKDGSAGSVATLKLTAQVGSTVTNLASAYSTADAFGSATADPDTSNNWAWLTTTVAR